MTNIWKPFFGAKTTLQGKSSVTLGCSRGGIGQDLNLFFYNVFIFLD